MRPFGLIIAMVLALPFARAEEQAAPSEQAEQIEQIDEFGSRSTGHLLTPNNVTLPAGDYSIGSLYLATGVTDKWTIGTSPFLLLGYEMLSVLSRLVYDLSWDERLGFDWAYFKTYGSGPDRDYKWREGCSTSRSTYCRGSSGRDLNFQSYEMEAMAGRVTYNKIIYEWYRLNVSTGYFHYFNDDRPFSFRMDPQNSDRYAISLTSLHELRLRESLFFQLEGGFWGLNYHTPYYHAGTSLALQTSRFLFQFGLSSTFAPSFPKARARKFASYDSRMSIHPEFQIQMFF